MHLTSSFEVAGPKSKNHYVITHLDERHDLLTLPESYSELEAQVRRLYHIERGQFHVETDDFNMCKGTRVRIPEEAWADVARLVGNVHIVPWKSSTIYSSPESTATLAIESVQGKILLDLPMENGNVLVIEIATMDAESQASLPPSESTTFKAQLLDSNQNNALTVSVLPETGWTLTTPTSEANFPSTLQQAFHLDTENHVIIVRNEGGQYHLLCDYKPIGFIEESADVSITSVLYDHGMESPLKGPYSATVHSNLRQYLQVCPLYRSTLAVTEKEILFNRIVECDPRNAGCILVALETLRREVELVQDTISGIKWNKQDSSQRKWIDLDWNMHRNTIFVVRGGLPANSSICLGPRGRIDSVKVTVDTDSVQITEVNKKGQNIKHGALSLFPFSQGQQRTIVFINHPTSMQVICDFCDTLDFSNTGISTWGSNIIRFGIFDEEHALDVDVYDFGE